MAFTATPTDGSSTPIPMSSVVPDGTNTPLALEGRPLINTGGNNLAPASVYVKDGNDITLGAQADAAATTDSGTFSYMAMFKRFLAKVPLIGPQVKAASTSITFATDIPTLTVAGTITEANSAASKTDLDTIVTNTNKLIAPSVNAGNRDATTQRYIESGNPTPTVTQITSAASDTSLLAANANKKGTIFFNDSTATLYLLYGTGVASTTNYSVQINPKGFFEDPLHYTGGYHGIWSSANGFVYCTEVS